MQIIKSHEKLHKPLADFLENEQTVEGQFSGCSGPTKKILKMKISSGAAPPQKSGCHWLF
jgi:hypothetical protein